jgi:hypothetical protein
MTQTANMTVPDPIAHRVVSHFVAQVVAERSVARFGGAPRVS